MGFGQFKNVGGRSGKPMVAMADINVTPMVDVMLVLLVIFIIAAPLLNHAIRLELPQAESQALPQELKTITLSFDSAGKLFWDTELVTIEQIEQRFVLSAKQKPQPEILLRADKSTRFESIAQVMSAAQTHGLNKIGFATEAKAATMSAKSSSYLPTDSLKK
nr:biopolymer transporter ExbD [uncultured Undibacterium sp.]